MFLVSMLTTDDQQVYKVVICYYKVI